MKVCMLTDKPLPSERPTGVGVAAYSMAWALSRRGIQVRYVCRGEADKTFPANDSLTVQTIKRYTMDNLGASLSILKEGGYEVFHVHSSAALLSLVAARAFGRPTVFHSHGDQPLRPLRLTLVRNAEMSMSQRVIAVSESTRQDLIRNHHIPASKVVVAYNGVDTDEFRPRQAPRSILAGYDLERYERIVLSIGALQPRKGQLTMIECLPEILKAWPGLGYVNVGTGYDEAFRAELLKRADALGVAGAVRLLSTVPREDLVALINAADLCIHPSTREPFGLAVVEEMACGKTVLALRIGAMPEIIDNGIDGILVEPNMKADFAKSILQALSDPVLVGAMGAAARSKVVQKFTWEKTAARLEEVYRGICS